MSGGGGGGVGQQQQQQKFTQTVNCLDRPVKKILRRGIMKCDTIGKDKLTLYKTSMKFSSIRAILGHSE